MCRIMPNKKGVPKYAFVHAKYNQLLVAAAAAVLAAASAPDWVMSVKLPSVMAPPALEAE